MSERLDELAARVGEQLKRRGESIAIAESSAGGLISAALLAVPGASAYFLGGAVVYTRLARRVLLDLPDDAVRDIRPSSEAYAGLMAARVRERFGAVWGLAETGATGPTGNRYGDAPGHACLAIAGPETTAITLETGHGDRAANMTAFARAALALLGRALEV
ncbi:MAG: CinA family protein [Rhodospirillales bacterium]|nr:nicotinamide-nucleotide amidohydrolase family protein [Rhodospirillales bacterium]MDE2199573.1 CinA family protein [Rhodospirillales bacterium]MDE2575308.1 CinA family protein [Rhodospirillales bacterium]